MLEKHQLPLLEHDTGVGGRYSALTNVGLLPAAILGLDIGAIRNGAGNALLPVLDKYARARACCARSGAVGRARRKQGQVDVRADGLQRPAATLHAVYVQLWAESLGKNGKGTTPVAALGPVDQHSQVQLFITGPRDKLFNVVGRGRGGQGSAHGCGACQRGEPGFAGKTIGDLVAAEGRATAETLAKNGFPVRTFQSLGELLMHFMLETIIAARICLASTRSTSRRWERARCWRRSI
jgi:glucose-6-phosphate isomerase